MKVAILPLIAVILFYVDTLINSAMPVTLFGQDFYFTSHLVLLYLLMLAVYKNPSLALIIGILLGIVSDVYLGSVYGIYTFSYIAFIMMMDQLFKVFYKDISIMMALLLGFIFLFECVFFVMYKLLSDSKLGFFSFVFHHGLPSALINFALMLVTFPLILKILERADKR